MKSYKVILLGKTSGEVIPEGMHKRIAAFIRKKCESGCSLESLRSLILQAFERDNIKGSLTIYQNGQVYLSVGN
jgi:hypothetical protein